MFASPRAAMLCFVIVSTAVMAAAEVAVADEAAKDAVIASWKERERHWAGKKVTWTERQFVAARSVMSEPNPDADRVPDADLEVEGDAFLGLTASGFVIERLGLQWVGGDVKKFLRRPMRDAVTKEFSIAFRGLEAGTAPTDSDHPLAFRDRMLERSVAYGPNEAPVLFFLPNSYRPVGDKSMFQIEEATITPDPDDKSQLMAAYDVGRIGRVCYLDAGSYLPVRYEVLFKAEVAKGVVSTRVTLSYADRKDPLCLPSSWEWAVFDREGSDRVQTKVTANSITTSSAKEFDLSDLPVGTMIMETRFDEAKKERKFEQYFVTPKGEYKLREGERRLPYTEFVEWLNG
jgi:hypothetical protein